MSFACLLSSYIPLLLLLLLLPSTTIATTYDLVHETCKESSKNDPNINYTFCLDAFKSTPFSKGANLTRLGLISINLVKKNVIVTTSLISHLLGNKTIDHSTKQAMNDCLELYSNSISTLSVAAKDYRAKRFGDANVKISAVMTSSSTCEQGLTFEDFEIVSPLTKWNNYTFELGAIALSIMNMVR